MVVLLLLPGKVGAVELSAMVLLLLEEVGAVEPCMIISASPPTYFPCFLKSNAKGSIDNYARPAQQRRTDKTPNVRILLKTEDEPSELVKTTSLSASPPTVPRAPSVYPGLYRSFPS